MENLEDIMAVTPFRLCIEGLRKSILICKIECTVQRKIQTDAKTAKMSLRQKQ